MSRHEYPADHAVVPAIVKKKKVKWTVDLAGPVPAGPDEVFAAWVDGERFAEITGKPAKGRAEVGAERSMFGAFARGAIVELEPPRRVLELWRSKDFPDDAPDSVLQAFFEAHEGGTMVHVKQWAYAKPKGRPLDYETMMFWSQKVLGAFRTHFASRDEPPAVAVPRPSGAQAKELDAWLGASRSGAEWRSRLVALAALAARDDERGWWNSRSEEQKGLEAWVRGLAPFGDAMLVRACVAAARVGLPVWSAAEKERPELFEDVVAGFEREGGAPPAEILAAVEAWLREPSTKKRKAAIATLDPTAQLRYSDEDLGDLSAMRWVHALEAARCAAYALEESTPAEEAPLAAVCALEAIRADASTIADAELARVCEAIRAELAAQP